MLLNACNDIVLEAFCVCGTEIDRFWRQTKRVIIPLTVCEILDEQIAHKLV